MRRPPWVHPLAWPALAFLVLFLAHPLAAILAQSLTPAGWGGLTAVLADPAVRHVLAWTTGQALLSSGLTVLLALPAAFLLGQVRFPGQGLAASLVLVPFVLPSVVVAAAFGALADPQGLVGRWTAPLLGVSESPGLPAIVAAHVFYNLGLAARMMAGAWARLPRRLSEAAATLGASPVAVLLRLHLPLLTPAILAAGLVVFALCFSSFGVVLLLGGGRLATLEVAIYQATAHYLDLPRAGSLALLQLAASATLLGAASALGRPVPLTGAPEPIPWQRLPRLFQGAALAYGAALLLGLVLPLLTLALESLRPGGMWGMEGYRLLFHDTRHSALGAAPALSLVHSLRYALLATALALPLGLTAALGAQRSRARAALETLCTLPMTASAATLGLGLLLTLRTPWWDARASGWVIPVAHALAALPLVVRTLLPALDALPPSLAAAAATLGARPAQVLGRVLLPLVARPLAVAATVSAAVSLGEFGASLFLVRPTAPTVPVAIARSLSLPGTANHAQAMALATVLMGLCAGLGLAAHRLSRTGEQP